MQGLQRILVCISILALTACSGLGPTTIPRDRFDYNAAILFLIQSGWPATTIFPLTVDSINGQRSQLAAGQSARPGHDDYYRVVELFREMQLSGATAMQIEDRAIEDRALLIIHKRALDEEGEAAALELAELLDIRPGQRSYRVRYGYLPGDDSEIALITRSMLQVIINLAAQISVPPEHISEGRTLASSEMDEDRRLIDVRWSESEPTSAFVKVRYRDTWYYIDDRDFASKSVFTFVMVLFSLTESGDNTGLPLVTIPAG